MSIRDETTFEVEEILDAKLTPYGWLYYVKWRYYPSCKNTWEPEDSFHQKDILESFWNAHDRAYQEMLSRASGFPEKVRDLPATFKQMSKFDLRPKLNDEEDVEEFLSIRHKDGVLCCDVKLHSYPLPLCIPVQILKEKCPSKLAKFYETIIMGREDVKHRFLSPS